MHFLIQSSFLQSTALLKIFLFFVSFPVSYLLHSWREYFPSYFSFLFSTCFWVLFSATCPLPPCPQSSASGLQSGLCSSSSSGCFTIKSVHALGAWLQWCQPAAVRFCSLWNSNTFSLSSAQLPREVQRHDNLYGPKKVKEKEITTDCKWQKCNYYREAKILKSIHAQTPCHT